MRGRATSESDDLLVVRVRSMCVSMCSWALDLEFALDLAQVLCNPVDLVQAMFEALVASAMVPTYPQLMRHCSCPHSHPTRPQTQICPLSFPSPNQLPRIFYSLVSRTHAPSSTTQARHCGPLRRLLRCSRHRTARARAANSQSHRAC